MVLLAAAGSEERMDGRPLVLVVDDDDAIRETACSLLEDEGYDVELAADGAAALRRLGGPPTPALILLDLMMPVMTGSELLRALESSPGLASIPVVLMTAAEARQETSALRYPLLRKPFGIDALLSIVSSCSPRLWDDGERSTDVRDVIEDPADTVRASCVGCSGAASSRCAGCGDAYCAPCLGTLPDGPCAACWRKRLA